jgi:L-threonylcarbamoyladenylate synthase
VTPEEAESFSRCIEAGGVALFPSDTVYGLATDPESADGVGRLYELKGRPPERPAAVMFFDLDLALAALPELGERTRSALATLLPGPVTLLVPNPAHRFPLACGPQPERLGVRVPALCAQLAPLAVVRRPVLQSSANLSGRADPRRIEDVDASIRSGADLVLDAGELPGVSSTVVDLSRYEQSGEHEVVREGALGAAAVASALERLVP